MKRFKVYSLVIAILAIIVLVIVSMRLLRQSTEQKYVFNTSSQTVIKELRELSRLETASYTIEKVIDAGTSGNQLQETLFGDRILLIAHGDVIAGFDLATLDEKAVQVDGTSLRMTLPPPQILSAHLDPSQTRVYDRKQGLLSRGDKDLESEARAEAETILTQAACQGNILTEASTNGRNQLTTLFKALGFTTVIITIPSGSC